MTRVAFIGAGGMGQGMAAQLLRAGFDLMVCSRTRTRVQPLVEAGARPADTPQEAVSGADYVISMVGDDADSRRVWLGEAGVLAGRPSEGVVAIECTTLSLGWVRELEERATAAGLGYVDCPVTGGRQGAASGELTLLVGAKESTLERARPVLEAFSKQIVRFGLPGAGTAYKLTVNQMVGAQAAALAEGLLLAERYGLDMEQVVASLAGGAVASPVVRAYAARMVSGDHDEVANFSIRWMLKDLRYGLEMATGLGQETPTLEAVTALFEAAVAEAQGEKNITYVIEALLSKGELRQCP